MSSVGDTIRKRRERLGWSREALADKIAVTATTVYRWETGRVKPSRAFLRMLNMILMPKGKESSQ